MEDNGQREFVQCELCSRWFGAITWKHLKLVHGISTYEYREEFPDAPMQCDEMIADRVSQVTGFIQSLDACRRIGIGIRKIREKKYWSSRPPYESYDYAKR